MSSFLFISNFIFFFIKDKSFLFKKHSNTLPVFDPKTSNAAGGDAGIIYHHSYWKLEDHEALVIDFIPPDCDNWNFQLNNYWMESLDYRYFPVCINKNTALAENNGKVRIIISKTNPGSGNWLYTCGHNEGTMCLRWYRLEKDATPVVPNCNVVPISELVKK